MCFCLRKPDEDVDTTLLFPNSVTQGVCRNTYDGHRFCALARLISHTHSLKNLIRVSLNTLIHHRAAPTAHARTIVMGDFNAKHKSWNPHSRGNTCGAQLYKFSKDCGYLITAPAEPTTIPHSARSIPSTLDFAISCGLNDIRVDTHVDLSSDHNPVQFIIKSSPKPYTQNCSAFTNWNLYQELLTNTIPGNPLITDTEDVEEKNSFFH
ncbi:RNA-directed DNA polymerase from mobile element jockey [Trichonephila clavipes]|nr:RNA-directed DNA polymerase from mobile element jockey [Trichonephila clavipes]